MSKRFKENNFMAGSNPRKSSLETLGHFLNDRERKVLKDLPTQPTYVTYKPSENPLADFVKQHSKIVFTKEDIVCFHCGEKSHKSINCLRWCDICKNNRHSTEMCKYFEKRGKPSLTSALVSQAQVAMSTRANLANKKQRQEREESKEVVRTESQKPKVSSQVESQGDTDVEFVHFDHSE